ncbi:MAG: LamG domain-containing protein [Pseudomonadota bacterium]
MRTQMNSRLVTLLLLTAIAAACDPFAAKHACFDDGDCLQGRVCDDEGWCVEPGTSLRDVGHHDAGSVDSPAADQDPGADHATSADANAGDAGTASDAAADDAGQGSDASVADATTGHDAGSGTDGATVGDSAVADSASGSDATSDDAATSSDAATAGDAATADDASAPADAGVADSGPPRPLDNGSSVHLDGSKLQRLHVPGHSDFSTPTAKTVEMWVKPDSTASGMSLMTQGVSSTGPAFSVRTTAGGALASTVWVYGATCAAGSVRVGEWSHVAVVFTENGYSRLYVNGQYCDYGGTDDFPRTLNDLVMGLHIYEGNEVSPFSGNLDEVRFWNTARTQAELQANMWKPLLGDEAGLVGYWDFEGSGIGQTVVDRTGHGHDARMGRDLTVDDSDPGLSSDTPFVGNGLVVPWPAANTTFTARSNAGSLFFANTDAERVHIPGNDDFKSVTALTVEMWVKPTTASAGGSLAVLGHSQTGPAFSVHRTGGGGAGATVWVQGVGTSGVVLPGDAWNHLAVVFTQNNRASIYVNGQYQSYGLIDTFPRSLNDLVLGVSMSGGTNASPFTGYLDEVRVWNVARSQAEIQGSMSSTLLGNEAGLIAYYDFESYADVVSGDQDLVLDRSTRGHHGRRGRAFGTDSANPTPSSEVPF